jgi:ABC-type glucose/galactose transport system permease subunit
LLIFSALAGDFNEYAVHKITTFFDKEEILEGGSSGFRLMSQGHLFDAFIATDKSMFIGNGWGQVYFDYAGEQLQAGGAEFLTALAYGGILSGIFYLIYSFVAINVSRKLLKVYPKDSANYEGMMFAVVGSMITGQINGAMIAPEYWMMYGIAIYFGYKFKTKR